MKKFLKFALAALLLSTVTAAYSYEKEFNPNNLPKNIKSFIATNFPDEKIVEATTEHNDINGALEEYEVKFSSDVKIDFDAKGEWTEIDCFGTLVPLPRAVIPADILQYVELNYPGLAIEEIKREKGRYEVLLSDRRELKFDSNFNLVK